MVSYRGNVGAVPSHGAPKHEGDDDERLAGDAIAHHAVLLHFVPFRHSRHAAHQCRHRDAQSCRPTLPFNQSLDNNQLFLITPQPYGTQKNKWILFESIENREFLFVGFFRR